MTTYYTEGKWTEPLEVKSGKTVLITLKGSAGASELDIDDNADVLNTMPSLYGSVDNGESFEPMSAELMQKLEQSQFDLQLSIDCSQMTAGQSYIINGVTCDKQIDDIAGDETEDHYWSDASQTAFEEQDLKKMVNDQLMELGNAAQDNAAWNVKYYKADTLKNIDVLNAYELKSITTCKTVRAFFPHRKTIGQLDFDQFGLAYEELTNLHILRSEFERVYGHKYARPSRLDIVYIPFLDQFFEVSDISDVKSPTNEIQYYDLTLKVVSDRQAVAKQDDILDISDMIDGNDREAMIDYKNAELAKDNVEQLTAYDGAVRDNGNGIIFVLGQNDKYVFTEHTAKTWSMQTFSKCRMLHITAKAKPCYMVYFDTEDNDWRRGTFVDGMFTESSLTGKVIDTMPLTGDDKLKLEVAKFAQFNKPLSEFEANMYFTSPVLSRNLQPLDLIELHVAK
jgi:hypothetical protein